ncbi:MAG: hypothetical protein IT445_14000 [Phycisphaeraceae bacterium]|nr:hypothetical protein [Phycisphaeraceae bacterium]
MNETLKRLHYWAWVCKKSIEACRQVDRFVDGESPLFYHCPSGLAAEGLTLPVRMQFYCLTRRVTRAGRVPRGCAPEGVAFVTVHNYPGKTILEKSFEARGIPCVVLGRDIEKFSFFDKIGRLLDYVRSPECTAEYIVFNDARDVVIVSDPGRIVEMFESCGCDVLMNHTHMDWPPNPEHYRFEQDCYPRYPFHGHLNSGGFVARRQALIEFLEQIARDFAADPKRDYTHPGPGDRYSDQAAWRRLHVQHYPRIKVDCRGLIFKRFDLFMDRD